jgi:predicted CopG family antitoxin
MRKKITLTIDSDVYDDLEELPRKVSISEFVNFMLKGYVETFKKGHVLSKEEVDEIVAKMGGEEFRERIRNTFPTLDRAVALAQWVKDAAGDLGKEPKKA